MATWGNKSRHSGTSRTTSGSRSSSSSSARPATRQTPSGRAVTAKVAETPAKKSGTSKQSGTTKQAIAARDADTGPTLRRRDQARAELTEAVSGREHEFIGIAFIFGGLLVGLAIYFKLAGILGRFVAGAVGLL